MDSLITTFHIDWKIIIAQVINFGIVFFDLYFFALKPLKKLMAERTERITKGLSDADQNERLLQETQNEYNKIIEKAKIEAHELFQSGKKEAENKKTEMIEKAKEEVGIMILNGKKILEAEKIKMVEEAKTEIVSIVVKATEKLLETNVSESFDEKSISQIEKI